SLGYRSRKDCYGRLLSKRHITKLLLRTPRYAADSTVTEEDSQQSVINPFKLTIFYLLPDFHFV
ncbi:hypothetical protein L9F63_012392, partial [Diploptera punctata]